MVDKLSLYLVDKSGHILKMLEAIEKKLEMPHLELAQLLDLDNLKDLVKVSTAIRIAECLHDLLQALYNVMKGIAASCIIFLAFFESFSPWVGLVEDFVNLLHEFRRFIRMCMDENSQICPEESFQLSNKESFRQKIGHGIPSEEVMNNFQQLYMLNMAFKDDDNLFSWVPPAVTKCNSSTIRSTID
ncbi:hypothetical protein ACP70R_004428 [Stipagrostis hirtigluma subsp. patula]